MFLRLNHKNLEVYKSVRELTTEIYSISKRLPANEKINFIQQIRRAALSVKLNLAEGASRKSVNERSGIIWFREALWLKLMQLLKQQQT